MYKRHLNSKHTNFLRQHVVYRKDRDDGDASSGGVAIIVHQSVACKHLELHTPLEAVAVRAVLFNKLVTLCSLYIPPQYHLQKQEFQLLIEQLPEPHLILGDFNAHNGLWGDSRCDARGRLIEQFLFSSNACLLNKKAPTYYSFSNKSYSSIDLSIASPPLLTDLWWEVLGNPYGSDRFPILLRTKENEISPHVPRWKVGSADWEKFTSLTCISWPE